MNGDLSPLEADLMTTLEVAKVLKVDPKTVSRWAAAGLLPSIRTPGGQRRYRKSDVRAVLRGERVTP